MPKLPGAHDEPKPPVQMNLLDRLARAIAGFVDFLPIRGIPHSLLKSDSACPLHETPHAYVTTCRVGSGLAC
jgi:hypothetical protein